MTRIEPVEMARNAVEAAETPHASAFVTVARKAFTRFGNNTLTQNLDTETTSITLSVGDGERKASIVFEDPGPQSIRAAAERVREFLKASPPDPEYMPPPPEGQIYPVIHDSADPEASECPVEKRMEAVKGVIATAAGFGLKAGGICENDWVRTAVATSTGNLAHHEKTAVNLSFTLDMGEASSYRNLNHESWREIPWREASEQVAREALSNQGQTEPEAGEYSLILEPLAVTNLLVFLYWSLDARRADEGLTAFSDMQGKPVSGKGLTLSSDPDGQVKGVPFNPEGLPSRSVVWIREGVLENFPCQRFWAARTRREPLFMPECLQMEGGNGSTRDLVSETGKGILIRRFWYIRFVDQKTLKLTGMTRDGVFLVENGRVTRPLKDFRWNWRPLELFRSIEAAGQPVGVSSFLVPPLKIGGIKYPST